MLPDEIINHARGSFRGAWLVAKRSFRVIKSHPQILIYPYLAIIFILITSPIVGRFVFSMWQRVQQPEVVSQVTGAAPHVLLIHLGLVTFSVFYALFVTAYFTCMISVSTLAELEDRSPSLFYGLKTVVQRFFRVTKFSILAIFFLPMGVIAQRRKFITLRGVFEAISSSFSLSMSQLAPEVVTGKKGVFETVRQSMDTLGQLWKESLVIRISLFFVFILLTSLSFLPKVIEHYWFDGGTAHIVGWIVTALLGTSSYVVIRVIGTVLTTTLYYQAKNKAGRPLPKS